MSKKSRNMSYDELMAEASQEQMRTVQRRKARKLSGNGFTNHCNRTTVEGKIMSGFQFQGIARFDVV